MWQGIAQLLEAACAALADPAELAKLTPEMREKLRLAARKMADWIDADSRPN